MKNMEFKHMDIEKFNQKYGGNFTEESTLWDIADYLDGDGSVEKDCAEDYIYISFNPDDVIKALIEDYEDLEEYDYAGHTFLEVNGVYMALM